ncbi:MAG TPA: toll/interleukin-1 receptor domain-containing protein [Pseudolabrys sp.]|nr:toll/interleukin-1 receptor domain-containing protein [Pseudolabrys sp.]
MAKLFISYSHRDEKALSRLHTHLAMLRRDGTVIVWHDREILVGDEIDKQVDDNLSDSDIFLALVSPDFLASKYCYEREMTEALKRHSDGALRIVPIILEPCDWQSSPLAKLKALPKDGKPISIWTNENTAYLDVITELRRILAAAHKPEDRNAITDVSGIHRQPAKRYRIRKEFDSIDRDDFREKAFAIIRDYFRRSIEELNEIGDPLRARFEAMSDHAFSCTVLNKAKRGQEAHITVHADSSTTFGGDISYSFSRRAPNNTANGFIRIVADEYELYLRLDNFSFMGSRNEEPRSPEEAAEALWHEFISHAGIDHD